MLDQVGAVLVVMVVGDVQTHFMHARGPGEQLAVPVLIQVQASATWSKASSALASTRAACSMST